MYANNLARTIPCRLGWWSGFEESVESGRNIVKCNGSSNIEVDAAVLFIVRVIVPLAAVDLCLGFSTFLWSTHLVTFLVLRFL